MYMYMYMYNVTSDTQFSDTSRYMIPNFSYLNFGVNLKNWFMPIWYVTQHAKCTCTYKSVLKYSCKRPNSHQGLSKVILKSCLALHKQLVSKLNTNVIFFILNRYSDLVTKRLTKSTSISYVSHRNVLQVKIYMYILSKQSSALVDKSYQ